MNISFAQLTWMIASCGSLSALLLVTAVVGVAKKKRGIFWSSFLLGIAAAYVSFLAFKRLESIHQDLLHGSPEIASRSDLVARYGEPTRIWFYVAEEGGVLPKGQKVECWIYEVLWLRPTIAMQFELIDDTVWARIAANNIR
jgi:hypothetical protein